MKKLTPRKHDVDVEARQREIERIKIADGTLPSQEETVKDLNTVTEALLGGGNAKDVTAAKQLNHALRLFCDTLPEEQALEIAGVYPEWTLGVKYKTGQYVRHGVNQYDEPQVYRTLQEHASTPSLQPNAATSHFQKMGFAADGTPLWVQPMGEHDAYDKGDIVSYRGKNYISDVKGNTWAPDVYGWQVTKK